MRKDQDVVTASHFRHSRRYGFFGVVQSGGRLQYLRGSVNRFANVVRRNGLAVNVASSEVVE